MCLKLRIVDNTNKRRILGTVIEAVWVPGATILASGLGRLGLKEKVNDQ
jgi:hypothetical protein